MGGCATKPKVLTGEEGESPAPAPEPAKEEVDAAAAANTVPSEAKDVVTEEGYYEKDKKVEYEKVDDAAAGNFINNKEVINKEIVEDEKVDGDDQKSKLRSLSNLFKNEQGKESKADESAPSEAVKEETKEAERHKLEEAQNSEVPPTPESFIDATDKDDTAEKTIEAAPAITTETKTAESSDQKTEAATESAEKIIQEAATESEEKKIEEAK